MTDLRRTEPDPRVTPSGDARGRYVVIIPARLVPYVEAALETGLFGLDFEETVYQLLGSRLADLVSAGFLDVHRRRRP